jgi:hypothetical protein
VALSVSGGSKYFDPSVKENKLSFHMRLRQWLLFLLLVIPGVFCFLVCMYYALQDWEALQRAYANFERVAGTSSDMSTLFVAEAKQNIHRINLFADVVWALLGASIAAIGIHGLCVTSQRQR